MDFLIYYFGLMMVPLMVKDVSSFSKPNWTRSARQAQHVETTECKAISTLVETFLQKLFNVEGDRPTTADICSDAREQVLILVQDGTFSACTRQGQWLEPLILRYRLLQGRCDAMPHLSAVGPYAGRYGFEVTELGLPPPSGSTVQRLRTAAASKLVMGVVLVLVVERIWTRYMVESFLVMLFVVIILVSMFFIIYATCL